MKEKLNVSFKMEDDYLPPLKTLATISFVILLCSMPLFALNGGIGEYVREYFGIIWHISMFFFINKLVTPIIISNTDSFKDVKVLAKGEVEEKAEMLRVEK